MPAVQTLIQACLFLLLQSSVFEAAEQRAGQTEEPELLHGVRT